MLANSYLQIDLALSILLQARPGPVLHVELY